MFLSNQLLFALRDHANPARDRKYADRRLTEAIDDIEDRRNAIDRYARPVPVPVRINKQTGEIIGILSNNDPYGIGGIDVRSAAYLKKWDRQVLDKLATVVKLNG